MLVHGSGVHTDHHVEINNAIEEHEIVDVIPNFPDDIKSVTQVSTIRPEFNTWISENSVFVVVVKAPVHA